MKLLGSDRFPRSFIIWNIVQMSPRQINAMNIRNIWNTLTLGAFKLQEAFDFIDIFKRNFFYLVLNKMLEMITTWSLK